MCGVFYISKYTKLNPAKSKLFTILTKVKLETFHSQAALLLVIRKTYRANLVSYTLDSQVF